ncbi:hypothetical protein [Nocardiopsis algeriensis]|uniref:Helix-turn-helix protein n=1 Tax=Nocardiopsis algeriensis TaxID=1478215 RepID=A0A841J160_9ACTN|nr:hypothetical protein [Nocardiopsis algeriensis]
MRRALDEHSAAEIVRLLRRMVPHLDQMSIGNMAGLAQSTVSRIEAGRSLGMERSLQALEALGASTGHRSVEYVSSDGMQARDSSLGQLPGGGVSHPSRTGPLREARTGTTPERVSRPAGLRPHIERAFAQETVTIDFAGFSGETLHGALQEPLDLVREGRMSPQSIHIRILVPDLSDPVGLPVRADTREDDPQVRARMRRIMHRHTQGVEDVVRELEHLGIVPEARVEIRVYRSVPMFKIYIINGKEVFFGYYPVKENVVLLGHEKIEIHDLMGRDSTLFRYIDDGNPLSIESQYVNQTKMWFTSIWDFFSKEPAE